MLARATAAEERAVAAEMVSQVIYRALIGPQGHYSRNEQGAGCKLEHFWDDIRRRANVLRRSYTVRGVRRARCVDKILDF